LGITNTAYVRACLIGLALALLVVGVVSGTLLRHIVQILPIVLALVVLQRRAPWGAYAALPIFLFWTGIAILIWLFLLGLSRIANGRYTPTEIVMTFVMAVSSVAGTVWSVKLGRPLAAGGRVAAVLLFAGLQVAAMWVSFLRSIASR
jgi:hypothetical protein